ARLSDANLAAYRTFVQPWVRAMSNEQLAALVKATNPARLQYTIFAHDGPFMDWVAATADQIHADRRPAAPDNPFLALQEKVADAIVTAWNGYRDLRDGMEERAFWAIYKSPAVQAALGTGAGVAPPRKPPAKTPEERAAIDAALLAYRSGIGSGGPLEAAARALLYVLGADRKLDERVAFALRKFSEDHLDVPIDRLKQIVRAQFFALELDRDQALRTLPAMIESAEARKTLAQGLAQALSAAGAPSVETEVRLEAVLDLLGVGDASPELPPTKRPARSKA
ncbi:MAG: DUF3141 domain-containing protein, partial [Caulobacteraceae bacterium]|nr:DUF3141 domain-containing protein [Caulobacteraceae bacterium]